MQRKAWTVYILKCSDGSYYTGITSNLEERLFLHQSGADPDAYTYQRRPIELVFSETFESPYEAIRIEKQIQGWSRKKKEALIAGDWGRMHLLAMNRKNREKQARGASTHPSTDKD